MSDLIPEGEPKIPYTRCELFKLLEYTEHFQHQRFNFFLVAESLFFAAAATTISRAIPTLFLAFAGIMICFYFSKINMKQQIRLSWLIEELKKKRDLYRDYSTCSKVTDHDYARFINLDIPKLIKGEAGKHHRDYSAMTPWIFTKAIPNVIYTAWGGIILHVVLFNILSMIPPRIVEDFLRCFLVSPN